MNTSCSAASSADVANLDRRIGPARRQELPRAAYELEGQPVRLLMCLAPRDEPVVGQDDRPAAGEVGDPARELESRTDVLDDAHVVAERLVDSALRVGGVRERADRVGMDVVDVRRGQERVQERLDRRPRRGRVDDAARQVREHLLVGHPVALAERQDVVQPEPGEMATLGAREVRPAPLDPDHPALAAQMVDLEQLRRGVPAAVQDERTVGADQPRARDKPVELRLARNLRLSAHTAMLEARRALGLRMRFKRHGTSDRLSLS